MPASQCNAFGGEFLRPADDFAQIPDLPEFMSAASIDAIRLELVGAASGVVTLCEYVRVGGRTYYGAQVLAHEARDWAADLPNVSGLGSLTVRCVGHLHAIADLPGQLVGAEMRRGDHLVWELGAGWRFESEADGIARTVAVRNSVAHDWAEIPDPVGAL